MNGKDDLLISVIIVNYNVKEFLEQSLISLKRALNTIPSEIIVVDNASVDGSVQMLRERFPDVLLIANRKNVGFSGANNQGLRLARGRYIVLLNPDTVVQEDTFSKLLEFFQNNPEASAATCKILNPDGTFSIDCRHSIPTPGIAFWKIIGLSRLFPRSKIFGKYNLTYLNEDETYQVEAISGSFMMMKREIVKKVGELDEDFFMYCEDIDYCHRINQAGGRIFYVPESQIIHYKGESTKKNNLDYVITFNRSLYKFYKKHYQQKYIYPLKWLILLGVILRGITIFIKNTITHYYPFWVDLIILNLVMFFSFWIRFEIKGGFQIRDFFSQQIYVNLLTSLIYFITTLFMDSLRRDRLSIYKTFKTIFYTFTFTAALTFFIKQLAFSRIVVLATAVISFLSMIGWRLIVRFVTRKASPIPGHKYFQKRTLIVGSQQEAANLIRKLIDKVDAGIHIVGVVSRNQEQIGHTISDVPVVASIDQIPAYLELNAVDLLIFTTSTMSYEAILSTMSKVRSMDIEFKMVPAHLEFMVSKSSVERLDDLPLVDIQYAYGKLFNRFIKRSVDIIGAGFILFLLSPLFLVLWILYRSRITRKVIRSGSRFEKTIRWIEKPAFFRFLLNVYEVLRGNLSFVGSPLEERGMERFHFEYKPGLTGILQINRGKRLSRVDPEKLELHYLKNHSFLLDVEIMIRSLFRTS